MSNWADIDPPKIVPAVLFNMIEIVNEFYCDCDQQRYSTVLRAEQASWETAFCLKQAFSKKRFLIFLIRRKN